MLDRNTASPLTELRLSRADIMPLWRLGRFDTLDIARHLGVSEANVYNLIFGTRVKEKPQPLPVATDTPARELVTLETEVTIKPPAWKGLIIEVLLKHKVSMGEFMGSGQCRRVTAARHEAMWRMSTELGMTLARIGRHINKDFATVRGGIRAHEQRMVLAQDELA